MSLFFFFEPTFLLFVHFWSGVNWNIVHRRTDLEHCQIIWIEKCSMIAIRMWWCTLAITIGQFITIHDFIVEFVHKMVLWMSCKMKRRLFVNVFFLLGPIGCRWFGIGIIYFFYLIIFSVCCSSFFCFVYLYGTPNKYT